MVVLIVAVVGLALAAVIWSRFTGRDTPNAEPAVTGSATTSETEPVRGVPRDFPRSRRGAVEAAAVYVGLLDGRTLLRPRRLRRVVAAIAAAASRDTLVDAYTRASVQARDTLGVGTVPQPIVIARVAPVGYRVDEFSDSAAVVSIWRVGVVGSGATADPRQSWATATVSLVWEDGTWKVASFESQPGPTPPLPADEATPAQELYGAVPEFREFARAQP